ncbi:UDP-glucuronate:xylan alpha-glucuronosyltransferase 2-like isoform X1 [Triticum dicoccoides]|uniref:UDP-glucuronate:xylan alpha-glucuronosyltransferase 2-like isoform X1 n=1 Tax=Triticum dicoccoides TaxID=85692 RepID=UPI000E78F0C9|nr:UDP-glucuronate:xylan alpha-glucuronosyltransferase 2-like isoform X1 [Triticum dicoccoides]
MKTGAGEAVKSQVAGLRAGAIVKLNAAFLAFFFLVYMALLLHPKYSHILDRGASSLVRCTFRDACPSTSHLSRKPGGRSVAAANKVVATERIVNAGRAPTMFNELRGRLRMGLVNIGRDELLALGVEGDAVGVDFDRVSDVFRWSDLFPEWIDEEEEDGVPSCPEIPMPDFSRYDDDVDVVVAALPCNRTAQGWNRDVFRLQVHLVAAQMAARKGRRDGAGRVLVVLRSECEPMMDLFRCDESVGREGDWWMYTVDVARLQDKLRLPVGSCNLALPLWGPTGIHEVFNASDLTAVDAGSQRREAYATVLHSSDRYLCGAIVLAQSIRRSGSTRDMVLLHDHTVSKPALRALVAAGWIPRRIRRIRNPRAERGSYNEYNYSKFRLWQLTEYFRVVFIDADILVLRSLDVLFRFPQISAVGNDGSLFNSGIMVIEPSACTFEALVRGRRTIRSYNGGDQGYLNEVFVWWHRLPRRVNYLKNFWANTTGERALKERLFRAEPAEVWSIHYLGLKPWRCYRDYDCNWNIDDQRVYASDEAHRRWWQVYDQMGEVMRGPCALSERRKIEIAWDRHVAQEIGYADQHWKINITDPRKWE